MTPEERRAEIEAARRELDPCCMSRWTGSPMQRQPMPKEAR